MKHYDVVNGRGVITKVFPSKDGRKRSAEVRTAKSTYIRPVAKLAIIKEEIVDSATQII